jgi:hypothetical protein
MADLDPNPSDADYWEAEWRAAHDAGNCRQTARWILGLHAAGRVRLDRFELQFVRTCAGWVGALSRRQQPIFRRILARVIRHTGQRPP